MLFNSLSFVVFLPIVFVLFWILPPKRRWVLLFLASYYFYMSWNPKYVVLILFTTFVSYVSAILMEKTQEKKTKKLILAGAAVLCLGVLFFFKYFNFLSQSATELFRVFSIPMDPLVLNLLLPVGISFYTFQTLSYVVDVYKGDIAAECHFGKFATFVSFFPQLVAGPIERAENLMPQIKKEHVFDYDQATYGMKLMAWGFFKKIVIADNVAKYVGPVFEQPHNYQGFAFFLAAALFAIQIYCDFSGYSDIAIGVAKLFGINLMKNFNSPYFAQSIKEFWGRWHISLSTCFRDYVYIPLGGNRVGKLRHGVNLFVTFLISGLWHGANWTFVVWGGLHGLAQIVENWIVPKERLKSKSRLGSLLRMFFVFCFCSLTWIFFASKSISDAVYILSHLFDGCTNPLAYVHAGFSNIRLYKDKLLFLAPIITTLVVYDWLSLKKDVILCVSAMKRPLRWCIYLLFALWIVINIPANTSSEFIYFQF